MNRQDLRFDKNEGLSLQRPAWIQDDLHAYRHRHFGGRRGTVRDYFSKRKGAVGK